MFSKQFEILESNCNHIQYRHLKIDEKNFNNYIIKSLFEDKNLYKYVTNDMEDDIEDLEKLYPIKQLIHLIKNLKKEYLCDYLSSDVKKKLCRSIKPKYEGVIINTKEHDWEEKFNFYLQNNITGYDVTAEIILSKIIEEKFGADVFVTKLAQATNNNMKVFGIDTVHYNEASNTMFFGESKLTNTVELGIKQHEEELALIDYKLCEECKLFALRKNDIRCKDELKVKIVRFGKTLTKNETLSILKMKQEDVEFNIAIVYFIAHGDKYDYDYITEKIEKFRKKIRIKNVTIYCVTLPIRDKNDFSLKVKEVINNYER